MFAGVTWQMRTTGDVCNYEVTAEGLLFPAFTTLATLPIMLVCLSPPGAVEFVCVPIRVYFPCLHCLFSAHSVWLTWLYMLLCWLHVRSSVCGVRGHIPWINVYVLLLTHYLPLSFSYYPRFIFTCFLLSFVTSFSIPITNPFCMPSMANFPEDNYFPYCTSTSTPTFPVLEHYATVLQTIAFSCPFPLVDRQRFSSSFTTWGTFLATLLANSVFRTCVKCTL